MLVSVSIGLLAAKELPLFKPGENTLVVSEVVELFGKLISEPHCEGNDSALAEAESVN